MMRSLYSGVSGLKTHQTKMDVIGNNIANVNTTAFKSNSIVFSELMSQTTQKASGPNAATGTGGTNARQIGLGVKSGAINTNIAGQGSAQSTGNPFDIMITGDNFFVVNNGVENFFTRDGSFYVDGAGNLAMTSTGYNVMGWGVDENQNIKQDTVAALRIMHSSNMTYDPEATSRAYVSGIIDRNDTNVTSAHGKSINLNLYDAAGYSSTARLVFKQSTATNEYSLEFDRLIDSTGQEIDISGVTFGSNGLVQKRPTTVSFNNAAYTWDKATKSLLSQDGKTKFASFVTDPSMFNTDGSLKDLETEVTIQDNSGLTMKIGEMMNNIAKAYGYEGSTEEFLNLYITDENSGDPVSVEQMMYNLATDAGDNEFPMFDNTDAAGGAATTFDVAGRFFDGTTVTYSPDNGKFVGIGGSTTQSTVTLGLSALGGNFSDIVIDFSTSSMVDNKGTSTIGADKGDLDGFGTGRRKGDMIGVSIQQNGMIYASYDNGMTKLLGQIATAAFANASGLEKQGDNLYSATLNSGEFDGVGVDVTANGGYMSTGQLEMSNVDLSSEFTEMITTQRGFQANSRIITVSDTMLEELTNLKR